MKVFIILAGLLMLGACTGKPEGFVLKGELKGAPDDHWVFLTNTSSWKGSHFHSYIDRAVDKAMATVSEWPKRDLFEMQSMDHEKLLVIR